MPNVPKPKPYTEEKFKQDADKFIKGYLGGFDKGEMNEFLKRSVDKIENAGVMSSDEAKDFIKERASYLREFAKENKGETLPQMKASGGRIGFLEGGTKYNAMVTKMYIEAGGQKGTGMDIDTFAEKYFPKMAQGGRIGFYVGGGADMGGVADSQGNVGPSGGGNNDGPDDRSTAAQTAAHNAAVAAAQTANKAAEQKMNIINTLNRFRPNTFVNPYNYSIGLNKNIGPFGLNVGINTLGILGIDDPRTPEDESEQDDYGISAGFNTDVLGGTLGLGAGYNPTTGTNLGLSFSKQFNQGGRVGFAEGPEDPSKRKFMKIMGGLASLPILGKFIKPAAKVAPAVVETFKNAPPHFLGLVNKIRALGRIVDPKKTSYIADKHINNIYDYGDYRIIESKDGGIAIKKDNLMATDYGDATMSEEYMQYSPGKIDKKTGKKIEDDSYEENTSYADQDGELRDVEEGVLDDTINEGTYSKEELEQLIIENIKKGE